MYSIEQLFNSPCEWHHFHDVVFEATRKDLEVDQLRTVFNQLPGHIQSIAYEWGFSDTVFGDNAYVYIRDNLE
jgi:hypothetical protein